jgi:hypothetical protein
MSNHWTREKQAIATIFLSVLTILLSVSTFFNAVYWSYFTASSPTFRLDVGFGLSAMSLTANFDSQYSLSVLPYSLDYSSCSLVAAFANVLTIMSITSTYLFILFYVKTKSDSDGSSNEARWRGMLGLLGIGIASQLAAVLEFSLSSNCVIEYRNSFVSQGYTVTKSVGGAQVVCGIAIFLRLLLISLTLIQARRNASSVSVPVVPLGNGMAGPHKSPEASMAPPPAYGYE